MTGRILMRYWRMGLGCVSACLLAWTIAALAPVAPAGAAVTAAWRVASVAYPSDFRAVENAACVAQPASEGFENCDTFAVTATNVGTGPTIEKLITLSDTVPAGLTVRHVSLFFENGTQQTGDLAEIEPNPSKEPGVKICSDIAVKCTIPGTFFSSQPEPNKHVLPDGTLRMYVSVTVDNAPTAGPLVNHATISGGGVTGEASGTGESMLEEAVGFGAGLFDAPLLGAGGLPEAQAGAHPYEFLTQIGLNGVVREAPEGHVRPTSVQDPRDVVIDLPVGLAGSGVSAQRCTLARLASLGAAGKSGRADCPQDTIVGHIRTYPANNANLLGPIYNLIPEEGYAAEFGFKDAANGTHVLYASLAPSPAGYVLRTTSREIPQVTLLEIIASVYGDPSARDKAYESVEKGGPYVYKPEAKDTPTFTNPESCSGEPLVTTAYIDSWQNPGSYNADGTPNLADGKWVKQSFQSSPAVTGCEALAGKFNPTLAAKPSSSMADSPTGLDVNLQVPQSEGVEALGTPPVKETVVTLPEGMSVNPSSANGLQACSEAQIGWQGKSAVASGEYENFNASPPACSDASQIGAVELETPALPSEACKGETRPLQECPEPSEREKTPVKGAIYVAKPYENPFGTLLAIYIAVNDPRTGVIVKIPARVEADLSTGRLTTTVPDTPQFPFSELRTHFLSGNTAALKTPPSCGAYTVGSTITPWSAPQSGPPATPSGSFEVTQGAGGSACGAPGFAPSFTAGTSTNQAGGFSPFSVTFSRGDGEQNIGGTSVTMPPGVSGVLTGVPLCGEPQAAQGECGEGSLVGEATTSVGAGPEPFWVHGGKVYLTGPYGGGPFGLSIVVPTTAGPYTLIGNAGPGREVVRASIHVDSITAQVSAVSDPLPTIIQGIPLDIRTVNVTINRGGFIFNPTNCNPMAATGTLTSTSGTSVPVSSSFQAANCAGLGFKPKFTAASGGKPSRKNGASLTTKLVYPKAAWGSQANIAQVKISLPRQLPARNSTLNHACPAAVFNANPATCPAESRVGTATATTPLLPVAMTGPAYFVSHGGAKFPELVIVLQGYGITVDLHGETFISEKTGITSSTFKTVPDVPVSSFELNLPEGPFSALAAPGGLCSITKTITIKRKVTVRVKGHKRKLIRTIRKTVAAGALAMPTTLTAQNGIVIKQNTRIEVLGCVKQKAKKARRA